VGALANAAPGSTSGVRRATSLKLNEWRFDGIHLYALEMKCVAE